MAKFHVSDQLLPTLPRQQKTYLHKGQIFSEGNCGALNFPKTNEINEKISALASKMGQIKKMKALYYIN